MLYPSGSGCKIIVLFISSLEAETSTPNLRGFFNGYRLSQIVRNMARVLFGGSETSGTTNHNITAFNNVDDEIYLSINMPDVDYPSWICLDIETAIQFSKQLRKSIASAKLNTEEHGN